MKKTLILWSFYILSLMLVNVLQAKDKDDANQTKSSVSKKENEKKKSSKKSKYKGETVGIIGLGGFATE